MKVYINLNVIYVLFVTRYILARYVFPAEAVIILSRTNAGVTIHDLCSTYGENKNK